MRSRPHEVTTSHLRRGAVIYLRQSTQKQVTENAGSADFQRAQEEYAKSWGWPPELIETIDDLGLSGTTSLHRPGYQRLIAGVVTDQIGAIFVSDISRLGRNSIEMFQLLAACRKHDVLVVVNGQPFDMSDDDMLFSQQINTLIADRENIRRRQMMVHGRRAKAEKGKAVSAAPTGYFRDKEGAWHLDQDAAVIEALKSVYRALLQGRSLRRALDLLNAWNVKIPRRRRKGNRLDWVRPTISIIYKVLCNPAYKGEYRFPQCKVDHTKGRSPSGYVRPRKARPDESVVFPNHHEPLVGPEEWEEAQRILQTNAPSSERRNLCPGNALLQGIIRCGLHNRAMSSHYARRWTHSYLCPGTYHEGGHSCGSVSGQSVDRALVDSVLGRLDLPALQPICEAWDHARVDAVSERRRRTIELSRARQRAEEVKVSFLGVNPANRIVAEKLEAMWEESERDVVRLEQLAADEPTALAKFTEESWKELQALCADLRAIWDAPTTTNLDRKQLIRTTVSKVIVGERDREHVTIQIVWADGIPDTHVDIKLSPYAHRVIAELVSRGVDTESIVSELNAQGLRTLSGNIWTEDAVRQVVRRVCAHQNAKKAAS